MTRTCLSNWESENFLTLNLFFRKTTRNKASKKMEKIKIIEFIDNLKPYRFSGFNNSYKLKI